VRRQRQRGRRGRVLEHDAVRAQPVEVRRCHLSRPVRADPAGRLSGAGRCGYSALSFSFRLPCGTGTRLTSPIDFIPIISSEKAAFE
jgi:hypothetical protein